MGHQTHQEKSRQGLKITAFGSGVNLFLVFIKLFFGIYGNSRALVADGIHSIADLLTDLVTAIGIYLGNLPPDEDHQFGHQKIETVAEIVMGIVLIAVGFLLMIDSGKAIYNHDVKELSGVVIIVAGISFVLNEILYWKSISVGKKIDSKVICINAWHHRSDALSSLALVVGLCVSYFIPALRIIDAYLSLFIGLLVCRIGMDAAWDALKRIVDTVPPDLYKEVSAIIQNYPKVRSYHNMKMRYIGNQLHIEFHIEVDPQMTIYDGHEVSHNLKDAIMERHENLYDVMIHIEPEGDDRFED